jgi:hypothetical protein
MKGLALCQPLFLCLQIGDCICKMRKCSQDASFYRHKKACVCRLFALQRRGALFAFFRMWLCRNDIARLYNHASDRLVRGKGTAAVNVLALVIALFGRFAQITAGASMGHATAEWTVHHKNPLAIF